MVANALALVLLGLGVMMFSEYKRSLVFAELAQLEDESRLWAGMAEQLLTQTGEKSQDRLAQAMKDLGPISRHHIYVFAPDGHRVFYQSPPTAKEIQAAEFSPLHLVAKGLLWLFPLEYDLPRYPDSQGNRIEEYPAAKQAETGGTRVSAWTGKDNRLIFSAAVPVRWGSKKLGTLLLVKDTTETESAFENARIDAVRIFLAAIGMTLTVSLYVSATVVRPLNRLARAAERVRRVRNRTREIPDMTDRGDEIGLLSRTLREMTEALWLRMDSIEQFAADVAHELKNPLTSLRSALETLPRIKDPEKQARLMTIMEEDTRRLDRLISDIARASRLDAELSRDQLEKVECKTLLRDLAKTYAQTEDRIENENSDKIHTRVRDVVLILDVPEGEVYALGNTPRLQQVFDNLVSNALSFSPGGGAVIVTVEKDEEAQNARIYVDDEGPGIPAAKLGTIFERFYSERPEGETYGTHSGLGLSIARQIVEAVGGRISAENRTDPAGKILGARLTVTLLLAE